MYTLVALLAKTDYFGLKIRIISAHYEKLQPCKVGGVTGLGQAEQYCTLIVHMLSCLYSTSDASLASVEVRRVEYSIQ